MKKKSVLNKDFRKKILVKCGADSIPNKWVEAAFEESVVDLYESDIFEIDIEVVSKCLHSIVLHKIKLTIGPAFTFICLFEKIQAFIIKKNLKKTKFKEAVGFVPAWMGAELAYAQQIPFPTAVVNLTQDDLEQRPVTSLIKTVLESPFFQNLKNQLADCQNYELPSLRNVLMSIRNDSARYLEQVHKMHSLGISPNPDQRLLIPYDLFTQEITEVARYPKAYNALDLFQFVLTQSDEVRQIYTEPDYVSQEVCNALFNAQKNINSNYIITFVKPVINEMLQTLKHLGKTYAYVMSEDNQDAYFDCFSGHAISHIEKEYAPRFAEVFEWQVYSLAKHIVRHVCLNIQDPL